MKILVPIKRVVDYNVKVRPMPDNSNVDLNNAKMSVNPFCEIALEEAVRIKEAGNAEEVIAITVGKTESQEQLRTALALGADRAILIETDSLLEPLAISKVLAKVRMCAGRREKYLRMQAQIQSILDRAKRPVVVQQHAGSKRSREAARSSSDAGQREVPGWKPWNGRLLMASSAEMGVRPAYKLVKIMKQKIHDLRAENRYHGDECKRCCLYHPVNSRCDLFTFPAHRSSAFREVWREGRSAGVLTSPIDEWNSRPRRLPQYRSDSNGKCIGKPMVKGPDHQ